MPVREKISYQVPSGEVVELFCIDVIAERIGRSSKTIRSWEISGRLPKSIFSGYNGVRYYSQAQIDIVAKYAEQFKASQGRSLRHTRFTELIERDFIVLSKSYGINK